jgi:hypothetical protein
MHATLRLNQRRESVCNTYEIANHPAIGESASGGLGVEVAPVGHEVALDECGQEVVVAHVHCGVPEQDERRHHRLLHSPASTADAIAPEPHQHPGGPAPPKATAARFHQERSLKGLQDILPSLLNVGPSLGLRRFEHCGEAAWLVMFTTDRRNRFWYVDVHAWDSAGRMPTHGAFSAVIFSRAGIHHERTRNWVSCDSTLSDMLVYSLITALLCLQLLGREGRGGGLRALHTMDKRF